MSAIGDVEVILRCVTKDRRSDYRSCWQRGKQNGLAIGWVFSAGKEVIDITRGLTGAETCGYDRPAHSRAGYCRKMVPKVGGPQLPMPFLVR